MQFQKISLPTPRKVNRNFKWEARGFQKHNFWTESMMLNCNFQKGCGVQKPSVGWYGYFLERHIWILLKTAHNKTFEQKFVNVSTNSSPCIHNTCIFTFTTNPEIVPTSNCSKSTILHVSIQKLCPLPKSSRSTILHVSLIKLWNLSLSNFKSPFGTFALLWQQQWTLLRYNDCN